MGRGTQRSGHRREQEAPASRRGLKVTCGPVRQGLGSMSTRNRDVCYQPGTTVAAGRKCECEPGPLPSPKRTFSVIRLSSQYRNRQDPRQVAKLRRSSRLSVPRRSRVAQAGSIGTPGPWRAGIAAVRVHPAVQRQSTLRIENGPGACFHFRGRETCPLSVPCQNPPSPLVDSTPVEATMR